MLAVEAWVFVGASYALIAFAYLWPPDFRNESPSYVGVAWTAFLVRTFIFHFGLVLVLIAAVAACVRYWRLLGAAMPLVLVTIGPTCWQFRPRSRPAVVDETVTVMSVNLLMINEYTEPIIDEIRGVNPDVLLLQEYANHWHDALQASIGQDYPHIAHERREDSFGTAIYSRRPFTERVNLGVPLGEATEPQMRAVVRISGRDVAFYNIHLLPPWGLEYTIENRSQFADLLDVLSAEKLPFVLAGDFNFTERSPNASALRRLGLLDTHRLAGWGRGTTWPVSSFFRWIPSIRLDHIYLGGGLTCAMHRTGVGRGSDHRPVIAEIGFAQ